MTENDKFRVLAHRYFEGTSSISDEAALHEFIGQDEQRLALFRQWHLDWATTHVADSETERAWESLSVRIEASSSRKPVVLRMMRFVAAAAVAALLVVGGVFVGRRSSGDDSLYSYSVPNGSTGKVVLPDGTAVWLNAGSRLSYSQRFNMSHRSVELHGEAYFEVSKHNGAKFTVTTNGYDVVVHGTKFNVEAYAEENTVTTDLIEGSVELLRGGRSLQMRPGETVTLDRSTGKLLKQPSEGEGKAWVDGAAIYDNMTLADLSRALSRRYGVKLKVTSAALAREKYSISLNNGENIDEVLRALSKVAPIKVKRRGNIITLSSASGL